MTNELASSVGLAVPCNGDDVFVLPRLIKSLEGEVLPINTLSVSVSGCNSPPTIESSSFKVIVNHVRGERSASENRNVAADCLDDDILSFMDSDDLVSPYRTQALRVAFALGAKAVVHNYMQTANPQFTKFVPFQIESICIGMVDCLPEGAIFPISATQHFDYHCAHVSLPLANFKNLRYSEDKSLTVGEDAEFLRRVFGRYGPITYIATPLSAYIRSQH